MKYYNQGEHNKDRQIEPLNGDPEPIITDQYSGNDPITEALSTKVGRRSAIFLIGAGAGHLLTKHAYEDDAEVAVAEANQENDLDIAEMVKFYEARIALLEQENIETVQLMESIANRLVEEIFLNGISVNDEGANLYLNTVLILIDNSTAELISGTNTTKRPKLASRYTCSYD
jgi:hypothetical protein